jgi:hypothetical protein
VGRDYGIVASLGNKVMLILTVGISHLRAVLGSWRHCLGWPGAAPAVCHD